jgi:hypothetical protein
MTQKTSASDTVSALLQTIDTKEIADESTPGTEKTYKRVG